MAGISGPRGLALPAKIGKLSLNSKGGRGRRPEIEAVWAMEDIG
jgi:hypothetical protein